MLKQLIDTRDQQFSFESHGVTLNCQRLDLVGYVTFHIKFSSNRRPLTIARAKGMNAPFFWTSIPEGRQKEAEGVGKLIEENLLDKD